MTYKDPHGWPLGHEKAATTPIGEVLAGGVRITSGYQKAEEMALLTRVVLSLPPEMLSAVSSAWCDSKHTCAYHFEMRPGQDRSEITEPIARHVAAEIKKTEAGYNALTVGRTEWSGAWPGDDGTVAELGEGWPDPTEPGVPTLALEDGFHWLRFSQTGTLTIGQWSADLWMWVLSYLPGGTFHDPREMAHMAYVGRIPEPTK